MKHAWNEEELLESRMFEEMVLLDEEFNKSSGGSANLTDDWLWGTDTAFEKKVDYILTLCIAVIGVIGNSLSFFLLTRPTFRRFSYAAYLRYLAVFDSINLVIELALKVDEVCISIHQWSFLHYNNVVTCKLGEFLRHACILSSSWLVAAFSLDRLVAVTCPLFKFKFCTVRYARILTVLVCFLCAVSQGFRIVFITARPDSPEHRFSPCVPKPEAKQMYFVASSFFSNFGMRFLLPFMIIATSNCIVLQILRQHGPWRPVTYVSRVLPVRTNARQTRLAKSALYLVCAYFVLTMSPSAALEMTWYVFQSQGKIEEYVYLLPFQAPFNILRLTNYSVNFFLYCISFRSFRHELRQVRYKLGGIKLCTITQTESTMETNTGERSTRTSCQ